MIIAYPPVPLPAHHLDERTRAWASSAPMRDLVAWYGADLPDTGTSELLAWLDDFSAIHWDFRGGQRAERDQVTAPEFDPALRDLVGRAAAALGFTGSAPPRHDVYDHVLVLGGLARTCLQRTEFAARLIADGAVTAPEVTALGSYRPLGPAETDLLPAGAGYEVDAFEAAFRDAFGVTAATGTLGSPGPVSHGSWTVRTLRDTREPRLVVLAAPSSEPAVRRANTPDTYHFWARQVRPRPGSRVLVITSPIYVPFQHCDAIRMLTLPYGCRIDTVGFDADRATLPLPPGATGTDRYLQEIRSAIRSMRRLHEA